MCVPRSHMPSQFATAAAYSFSLLIRQGVSPKRILAVTFTKKAADEMRDRIARLLELPSASGLNIMTAPSALPTRAGNDRRAHVSP